MSIFKFWKNSIRLAGSLGSLTSYWNLNWRAKPETYAYGTGPGPEVGRRPVEDGVDITGGLRGRGSVNIVPKINFRKMAF